MQKVLIITYYWPPAGGPGVQRWLKFVKYLRDYEIEPIVYIPENPNYPIIDESLLDEVPAGIKIYKKPIYEPYGFARLFSKKKTKKISAGIINSKNQSVIERVMLWIRGNLFIPDARKFWIKPSVNFLVDVIKKENIGTVISTGPPHSLHLIGLELKKRTKIRWITDFRDPWTSIGYHKKLKLTKASRTKHKHLEKLVLNEADKIIVTSKTTKQEFTQITQKPIAVITNGYDTTLGNSVALDVDFTISHIGSLLTGRNPINLWKALSELIQEYPDFKKRFKLQLAGVISSDVLESIYFYGLQSYTKLLGYISHDEAIQYQRKSQVLLLIEIDSEETQGIIPGKVFEYMATKRPILGVGPSNWEVGDLIAESKTGKTYTYSQLGELKTTLLQWFQEYKNDELVLPLAEVEQYHRRELTAKLSKFLVWE
ncbi:glycosyltransferase family 4 protein [Arenibacter palladensis]|uniref:glycosyltransferase family 4 protein n=1 Tax=Arenibacter palladensis TaxID=237373 RepID=UPI0026E1A903|nr:glycosyltransferase family 4 protein [Arenibacter palladensis]MDO6601699.1 glycosyltransferase family 4 protein [Arenibacter palladensis]